MTNHWYFTCWDENGLNVNVKPPAVCLCLSVCGSDSAGAQHSLFQFYVSVITQCLHVTSNMCPPPPLPSSSSIPGQPLENVSQSFNDVSLLCNKWVDFHSHTLAPYTSAAGEIFTCTQHYLHCNIVAFSLAGRTGIPCTKAAGIPE